MQRVFALCAAVSIAIAVEASAQERQVPADISAQAESSVRNALIERDPAKSAEGAAAVAAANAAIREKLRTRTVSPKASVAAMAVLGTTADRHHLIVAYRLSWVIWSQTLRLPDGGSDIAGDAARAAATLDLTPLEVKVIDKSEANRLLQGCDARLSALVREPVAPFFNRPTNVRWDERAGAPVLRSFARVSEEQNDCVRADLNLVTGDLMCRRVACRVQ